MPRWMRRIRPRTALVALVALVAVGWLLGARLSDGTGTATGSGGASVGLVVDFGTSSGRPAIVRKVQAFAGTGWQLFSAAGVRVEGTADYPTSFVCRIDGWPNKAEQDCASAPGASQGHWAYFVSSPTMANRWMISGIGAAGHRSKCGESEAWVWVLPGKSLDEVRPHVAPPVSKCSH